MPEQDKYQTIVDFLKQVGFRRGLLLFLAGVTVLILWKADPIALIDRFSQKNAGVVIEGVHKDGLTTPYVQTPNGFVEDKAAEHAADGVAMENVQAILGYKFVPSSNPYEYQGRLLVFAKTKQDEQRMVSEIGLSWLPILSGKATVERILAGQPNVSVWQPEKQGFYFADGTADETPSLNTDLLAHGYGVRRVYRYPVKKGGRVAGYLAVYAEGELDAATRAQLETAAARLGAYL
ncbi:hypothetical protein A7P96_01280 [Eikenella sp. NML03-A-027]|uniref:hypothetical protein n=1 Tax=unclassified Eikenella TaxID=2639367 RepID=UPI0007E049C1|nr:MULTISPECIES: hypothetical protein [unclassified Eikenella]OAM27784.1 hypothetical protein A7P94_05145 [Eikenella sp. NML01-A-086]OAM32830.1 hypothetical protein A7P96_01280 [Eikenella sp. NML03-A-027]OAM33689.1 hypothetical protein A7P97_07095 [Eikenella sp. NML070372]